MNFSYEELPLPAEIHSEEQMRYLREEFQVRDDDVFIVTYPKSGTTWMQEVVSLIFSNGDLTPVQTIPSFDRVPWLEQIRSKSMLETRASPRLITSHLLYRLMPKSFYTSRAKVIYVIRNPKDVLVSSFYYHGMASFVENPGTFDEFFQKFLEGKVMFGSWFDHVNSWWAIKDNEKIIHVSYEEMLEDMRGVLLKLSDFLGKKLSEEIIEVIVSQTKFCNMKQNKMSNYSLVPETLMNQKKSQFFRKGICSDWKNNFTVAHAERFDLVFKQRMKEMNLKLYDN
uniref:Sulfotransferase n=2 Tax=Callorhinchus milii TaxID=7868 RepID=V9KUZ1_CALMI|eukprot:gi/632942763/ref/XP_007886603.1/ PREDICTED: sulfotransferase family cytosolic 2B member 1-like [Callorhinchus milii]